jgi:hypothetical protein
MFKTLLLLIKMIWQFNEIIILSMYQVIDDLMSQLRKKLKIYMHILKAVQKQA